MIQLTDIRKTYKTRREHLEILKSITLTIPDRSFVILLGESGSGKSTLCNILGLLDTPTSGEYSIDGVSTNGLSSAERTVLRRDKVGFIFQNCNLIGTMTAFENIELPLGYRGIPKKERDGKVSAALESVGLEKREDHLPSELSGGEQPRIAIARALVTEPTLLIADEPTGNLDRKTTYDIMNLIADQRRARTVVMVTHDEELTAYGDIVLRMVKGQLK